MARQDQTDSAYLLSRIIETRMYHTSRFDRYSPRSSLSLLLHTVGQAGTNMPPDMSDASGHLTCAHY